MFGCKFCLYILRISTLFVSSSLENIENKELAYETNVDPAEHLFTKLFVKRRREQLDAVKSLVAIDNYEKQYKMVALMTDKIFNVIEKSRTELENSNYIPGNSSFPDDQQVLDALANTMENTALFADILLRLPDVTHKLLKSNPAWGDVILWSIGFVNQTNLLDKQTRRLMYLVSQELNITERNANYVNPYSKSYRKKQREQLASTITPNKKKKKQRKKGPQLSSGHYTGEL